MSVRIFSDRPHTRPSDCNKNSVSWVAHVREGKSMEKSSSEIGMNSWHSRLDIICIYRLLSKPVYFIHKISIIRQKIVNIIIITWFIILNIYNGAMHYNRIDHTKRLTMKKSHGLYWLSNKN